MPLPGATGINMLRPVNRRVLLPVAGLLVAVGLLLIFFPFNQVDVVCAQPGEVSSGFVDDDQGCPISTESYQAIADEEARFKVERVAGLGVVVAGLAVGGVALARKGDRARPPAPVS